jgi:hypothetical protein
VDESPAHKRKRPGEELTGPRSFQSGKKYYGLLADPAPCFASEGVAALAAMGFEASAP